MKSQAKIEFGDFQTPQALAHQICTMLKERGINPEVVIEPTCGLGSFLIAAAEVFPQARLTGWDINCEYVEKARSALAQMGAGGRSTIMAQDFFDHDWDTQLSTENGVILILGNLPWVTNSAVSALNGANLPIKNNFHGFRGIEARTGKSNFDISEWMLIRLLQSLRGIPATIAMLCKTATARKFLRFGWQNDGKITTASIHRIDAKRHFSASVDACLLIVQTGADGPAEAPVFDDLETRTPTRTLGLTGEDLVSNIQAYRKLKHFEGRCSYQWRSGVKHDCASVMELWRDDGATLRNKLGEQVEVESDYLFPLLKCSDLANGRTEPRRFILVTQTRVGEDTSVISRIAPRTWDYLDSHRSLFDARKSSIYANRIPFALFGIGDYSFTPWKVAISGLHKTPRFVAIGPFQDKPFFFDDASYFLPFESPEEALMVAKILNSSQSLDFISSLIFEDSKRPITVNLLQRLNIHAIAQEAGLADEWAAACNQRSFYPVGRSGIQAEFLLERTPTEKA